MAPRQSSFLSINTHAKTHYDNPPNSFVMYTSFISPQPLQTTKSLTRTRQSAVPLCTLDSSKSGEPSRDLSQTDREYLAKVKARLFNVRRKAAAARSDSADFASFESGTSNDDDMLAIIPDDLDAMEDILYDRGPSNARQVKMFGAWLDDAVAGRKAADATVTPDDVSDSSELSVEQNRPADLSTTEAVQRADAAFSRAMTMFNKGMYSEATALYADAVQLVGAESRRGGQYQLWQGQSLDAAGQKGEAAAILQGLEAHRDAEVRKVSRELLFILTAPRLQLDPESYLEIPQIDESKSHVTQGLLLSNFGPLRTALVEKPPEKYSLQWYVEKERPPKVADHSGMQAIAVTAAIVGTLAFMAASH